MCSRTVELDSFLRVLACWKDPIVVGSTSENIIILDAITGSAVAVLSGHTEPVRSLTFSSDGMSLVSGGDDKTIKLWDMQTGGVVKTLYGHLHRVNSVSISLDHTVIASGSFDRTICLWDISTGVCYCTIKTRVKYTYVDFSPSDPQIFISIGRSGERHNHTVQQWDVGGRQIGSTHKGSYALFSPDGICFLAQGGVVTMLNDDSGTIVAECPAPNDHLHHLCFSPDGRYLAGASYCIIYIWDVTSSGPRPVNAFVASFEPTIAISSLKFSSSLTLLSCSRSIKFWQIGASSTVLGIANSQPIPSTPSPIVSISLQANASVVISIDSAGMMKIWDILTGCCKESFYTPVIEPLPLGDARLINGRLILVWFRNNKIHIHTKKGEGFQTVDMQVNHWASGLKISGDGSKVFWLGDGFIQAWSTWTGETVGKVKLSWEAVRFPEEMPFLDPFCTNDSRVWVCFGDSLVQGWDFGITGSSPIPLSNMAPGRPQFSFILGNHKWSAGLSWIKDTVTGQEIFQLSGRYANPIHAQWDGQYLAAGYKSGEVLILDFNHILLQ